MLFISKINCRLTVSRFQGLVWVWGSILDVIKRGPELLRGDNVTTPRSSAAGSAASRYSGGQVNLSWRQFTAKLQKVHSLSGHSVLYILRILKKACGQIKLYKQHVQLFSYFTCRSKESFNLVEIWKLKNKLYWYWQNIAVKLLIFITQVKNCPNRLKKIINDILWFNCDQCIFFFISQFI